MRTQRQSRRPRRLGAVAVLAIGICLVLAIVAAAVQLVIAAVGAVAALVVVIVLVVGRNVLMAKARLAPAAAGPGDKHAQRFRQARQRGRTLWPHGATSALPRRPDRLDWSATKPQPEPPHVRDPRPLPRQGRGG